jgi:hypothetical protein
MGRLASGVFSTPWDRGTWGEREGGTSFFGERKLVNVPSVPREVPREVPRRGTPGGTPEVPQKRYPRGYPPQRYQRWT